MDTATEKKPLWKKWWVWVIVLLLAVTVLSRGGKKDASASESASDKPAATEPVETDAQKAEKRKKQTISAASLYSAYEGNEVSADNNYKGKTFYVSGTVESIGKDIMGQPYVSLKTSNVIGVVQCVVKDAQTVANISKGDRVTLHGECEGKMMNVLMKDCEVVPNL